MKIFSSVSAILFLDTAIASPFRAHQGYLPSGAMIILHVASRMKPVNFIWGIERPGSSIRDQLGSFDPSTKVVTNVPVVTIFSRPPLHCCNTRHAIEGESRFRTGHRL